MGNPQEIESIDSLISVSVCPLSKDIYVPVLMLTNHRWAAVDFTCFLKWETVATALVHRCLMPVTFEKYRILKAGLHAQYLIWFGVTFHRMFFKKSFW